MQASDAVVLDVREIVPRDRHSSIFAALAQLKPGGVLTLLVDHEPQPLWYQLEAEQPDQFDWVYLEQGPELWRVQLQRRGASGAEPEPLVLDNRGLEPPQPLVRTLEALPRLRAGQPLVALMDREPLLLFPQLVSRGYAYTLSSQADGSCEVRIWKDS